MAAYQTAPYIVGATIGRPHKTNGENQTKRRRPFQRLHPRGSCRGATEGECARARITRSLWSRRLLPPLTQEPPKLDKLVSGNPAAVPLPLGGRLLVNANNVTVLNEISFVGEAFRLPFCKHAARTNKMAAHQIPPFIVGTGVLDCP